MVAARRAWAADLLHFWFHELGPDDWFGPAPWVDAALERRFGRWLAALRTRPANDFLTDPATARAAVLLFDQVPRNVYRGSALAFATDPLARTIAHEGLRRGWDSGLDTAGRQFLAMPLMHSEDIADQCASIEYFTALDDAGVLEFARAPSPHNRSFWSLRSLQWLSTPQRGARLALDVVKAICGRQTICLVVFLSSPAVRSR